MDRKKCSEVGHWRDHMHRRRNPLSPAFSQAAMLAPHSRKFKSHSFAHRGARVIDTDTLLRISLVLRVSSDGQEHEQDSEDNPNVNAHQGSPAAALPARQIQRKTRAPIQDVQVRLS